MQSHAKYESLICQFVRAADVIGTLILFQVGIN